MCTCGPGNLTTVMGGATSWRGANLHHASALHLSWVDMDRKRRSSHSPGEVSFTQAVWETKTGGLGGWGTPKANRLWERHPAPWQQGGWAQQAGSRQGLAELVLSSQERDSLAWQEDDTTGLTTKGASRSSTRWWQPLRWAPCWPARPHSAEEHCLQ
jgi:hypothetical protein